MKKIEKTLFALLVVLSPSVSQAFCPVCTIAVGAGLGLSRYLKIDDAISGIWVGAVLISGSLWFAGYLKKRKKDTLWSIVFTVLLYATTLIPLYYYDIIGHPRNQIIGIDKLIFGIIIGTIIFPFTEMVHKNIKKSNGDKSYFPFQSTAIPIVILILASLTMYIIIK